MTLSAGKLRSEIDFVGSLINRPPVAPSSFVACVSDNEALGSNLLASPCRQPGFPHQMSLLKNAQTAGDGLNLGIERASHHWVVCLHQDVFLPPGWDRQLHRQLETATRQFGPIGVAGVYGVIAPREVQPEARATDTLSDGAGQPHANPAKFAVNRIGRVIHRGHSLFDGPELPALVATLDEMLLIVPRDTPLRLDPALGFHLYGAGICLQAQERGLAVVVLDAVCHHNTQTVALPKAFFRSAGIFAESGRTGCPWPRLASSSISGDECGCSAARGATTARRPRREGEGNETWDGTKYESKSVNH
jgi:Glycosyltransferase like family